MVEGRVVDTLDYGHESNDVSVKVNRTMKMFRKYHYHMLLLENEKKSIRSAALLGLSWSDTYLLNHL
mgnify:CR=1 FL=1